jgi:hypothetical protein
MRAFHNQIFLVLLSVLVLSSCDDDDNADDFPNGTGIKGRVNVQNEFQQPLYEERGGIQVFFEVGFQSFTVSADAVGQYQLEGAPTGTYDISFIKPGFGTNIAENITISNVNPQFQVEDGFQKLPSFTITKLPVTSFSDVVLDLTVTSSGQPPNETFEYQLNLEATINPSPPPTGQAKGYRVFIGTDEFVSPEEYIYQEHLTTLEPNISLEYDNEWFEELGIELGDELHVVLYGDANFDLSVEDNLGNTVFPNISAEAGGTSSIQILP